MTTRKEQHEKVRVLLKNAVTSLCRQGLGNNAGFSIEALIGITLEDGDVMLISINETVDDGTISAELMTLSDEELQPSFDHNDPTWPKKRRLFSHSLRYGSKRKRGKLRKVIRKSRCIKAERFTSPDEGAIFKSIGEKLEEGCVDEKNQVEILGDEKPLQTLNNSKGCLDAIHQNALSTDPDTVDIADEGKTKPVDTKIPHVGPYKCSECSVVYKYRKCLVEHWMKAHNKTEEQVPELHDWPCNNCNRVFPSKRSLTRHIVIHSENRPRHRCHICSKTFSCKRHVEFHVSTVHQGHYPFVCDFCGKQVTTKAALEGHMASKHLINKIKCEKCNREYARPAALASHVCTEKPTRFEETVCHICKKSFDLPKRLTQHMAKHSEPRFQCEQCGRNFKWASSLQAHKVAAHSLDGSPVLHEQQQQQAQLEQPSFNPKPSAVISSPVLPSVPEQTKESHVHSILTLNELSVFAQHQNSHAPPLGSQLTEHQHLVSVLPTIPLEVPNQHVVETTLSHQHAQGTTEVTSTGGQSYLTGLPTSTDIGQMQTAWQASFVDQTTSATDSRIQPPAQ